MTVPAGTTIARVALPAATIAALRTPEGGDLRVFNATGQLLPYALIDAACSRRRGRHPRPAGIGAANPQRTQRRVYHRWNAPTLRIIEGPQRRVIEYSAADAPGKAKASPTGSEVRGWLFDTRNNDQELRAAELEATLPAATIVKVTLSASSDLKTWRILASDVPRCLNFRPLTPAPEAGRSIVESTCPSGTRLKDQYLRLTWSGAGTGARCP